MKNGVWKRWLGGSLFLVVLGGCGGEAGVFSCNVADQDKCYDYGEISKSDVEGFCGLLQGTVQEGACSATNRVGRCTLTSFTTNYYSPTFTSTTAENNCNGAGGTFE